MILTLHYENHCAPVEAFADGAPLALPAQAGTLVVLLVQYGQCLLRSAGGEWAAFPGTLVAAAGAMQLLPGRNCTVAGVRLAGSAAAEAATGLAQPLLLPGEDCPGAPDLLLQLQEGADRLAPAEASAMAYTLLCRLAGAGSAPAVLSPLVAAAVAQIREHHGEVYGVEELAASLEVSKSHLIRCFSAEVGTPPGRYLTQVRVDAAKRLLLRSDYPLDVIAGLCGFSGANYLCKVFRKETGETPAAWRRRAAPAAPAPPGILDEQLYL